MVSSSCLMVDTILTLTAVTVSVTQKPHLIVQQETEINFMMYNSLNVDIKISLRLYQK